MTDTTFNTMKDFIRLGFNNILQIEDFIKKGGQGAVYLGTILNPFGLLVQRTLWGNPHLAEYLGIKIETTDDPIKNVVLNKELRSHLEKIANERWNAYVTRLAQDPVAADAEYKLIMEHIHNDALSQGTKVAVKVMHFDKTEESQKAALEERFYQEYHTLDNLRHRNIVRTIAMIPETPLGDCMVLEYLDGTTLKNRVYSKTEPAMNSAEALEKALIIGDALEYCHRNGVVHRDVKSDNIMILKNGTLKLYDFGICKVRKSTEEDAGKTQVGVTMGAPSYMAPEQWGNAERATPKSDVYGLASTLYELVTRSQLYACDTSDMSTVARVYKSVMSDAPHPFSPELPAAYLPVLEKALAKKQDSRSTLPEFLEQLRELRKTV